MEFYDSDVIVVGAGPTGLMLAGELRLAGVSVVVLDKLSEPIQESRALGFSARTIEEFAQRGLMDRFGEVGVIPVGHFGGVPLDYRVIEGGSYGARGIPQARTEGVLGGWARELGADIRRGCEVTGIEQTDASVTVTAAGADGPFSLRARHVVGCDGARSIVRKLAGIGFPGTEPPSSCASPTWPEWRCGPGSAGSASPAAWSWSSRWARTAAASSTSTAPSRCAPARTRSPSTRSPRPGSA